MNGTIRRANEWRMRMHCPERSRFSCSTRAFFVPGQSTLRESRALVHVESAIPATRQQHYFHDITNDLTVLVFFAGGRD